MAGCKTQEEQEEIKTFHKLHVLGMNDDLWDRVCGLSSETWLGCERVEQNALYRIKILYQKSR